MVPNVLIKNENPNICDTVYRRQILTSEVYSGAVKVKKGFALAYSFLYVIHLYMSHVGKTQCEVYGTNG